MLTEDRQAHKGVSRASSNKERGDIGVQISDTDKRLYSSFHPRLHITIPETSSALNPNHPGAFTAGHLALITEATTSCDCLAKRIGEGGGYS